jgi:NADPH-dependent 2,4-dienoyl-CoA reductase/sulfur reductase-like enzyme
VGGRVPIDYKLSIIRPNEGKAGPTLDEAKIMARWLVETGVDSFHVSLANHTGVHHGIPPMGSKPIGCFVDLAEAIKKVVNVPVAAVGRIVDPKFAEAILADGKADLVSLCRGLVADPEWPLKVQEGRNDDIRKCIMCNQGCTDRLLNRQSISCSINATVGKEVSSRITKAETAKAVLVIGGGPAGMEAARVAALRGHRVTLMEKADRLGGQLNLATIPPHKEEMDQITEYLSAQIEKLGVNIKLNEEATPATIEELKPDEVIVATGATPLILDIPGVQAENVTNAWDVLAGKSTTGQRVIVVGGGSVGSETAEFLAESGKAVTIVEMLEKICIDMSPTIVPFFMERIKPYRLKIFTQHKLLEINDKGVITMDDQQQKHSIEADTVVMAVGAQSNNELVKGLQEKGIKVHAIGDCSQEGPRKLFDAVHEGYFTTLKI